MSDYPDGTLPIGITACYIDTLPVDIKAQTIGNIGIDIMAQTLGDVNVNITNATITVTGTVSISGTVTVAGTVTVSGTVSVSGTVTITGAVTITSGTVSISGTVTISGSVNITNTSIAVVNATGTTIAVSGTVSISGTVTVSGTVSISGTVTVTGSVTVSGTVSISGTVTVTGSVTVSGTVAISGTVTVTGSVTVSGAVSITGTVTITGSVTITSGTINIQTGTGTNIIIDKLTQVAYTERRATVSNQGTADEWTYPTGNLRLAKFFPRGMRGFIESITVYCKNVGAGDGTITLYVAPTIGAGYLYSATIPISAGASEADRSVNIRKTWNYDAMFVWYVCSSTDVQVARDANEPYDEYYSEDAGVTWQSTSKREMIKVVMKALTVGDIPVSGTINVVEIPRSSSVVDSGSKAVTAGVEATLTTTPGVGTCDLIVVYISAATDSDDTLFRVYCDGVLAFEFSFVYLNTFGIANSTPGVSLTKYNANGVCGMVITKRFEFTRELKTAAYHGTQNQSIQAWVHPNLRK